MKIIIIVVIIAIIFMVIMTDIEKERRLFIKAYAFPDSLHEKVKYHYPHLNDEQLSRVMEGLRATLSTPSLMTLSIPSQVVYVVLQEFMLNATDDELRKLRLRLGRSMPSKLTSPSAQTEDGMNHAWELCCQLETIDATNPARLPLLFALDAELDIPDGFRYSLDDCVKRYREYLDSRTEI